MCPTMHLVTLLRIARPVWTPASCPEMPLCEIEVFNFVAPAGAAHADPVRAMGGDAVLRHGAQLGRLERDTVAVCTRRPPGRMPQGDDHLQVQT